MIYETLTQAYKLTENLPRPYPPEVSTILSMFVSPDQIRLFDDPDLYLKLIGMLIDNRENAAFPEDKKSYDDYFRDCIDLKEQMKQAFSDGDWLADCLKLLENLKTPYYDVYADVLFDLNLCFPDRNLYDKTLRAFYAVIIRADEGMLQLIRMICDHGREVCERGWLSGELLSDLLIHQLSVYASGKDLWKYTITEKLSGNPSGLVGTEAGKVFASKPNPPAGSSLARLMSLWLQAQDIYLDETNSAALTEIRKKQTLADWLCSWEEWLAAHQGENLLLLIEEYQKETYPADSRKRQEDALSFDSKKQQGKDSTFLNTYAYNMNARSYITNPAIGRDQEIRDLELILISPKKSPILIGDAGVGKTSVAEGLAWRLQRGQVPDLLKNKTLFKLTTTSLLSGTKYVGEMEDRIKQLTAELAKYPDVILFIDEIHTIVGAGSTESSHNDISNMLKPFIDRGDIKIIGATTVQEYEAYLLPDRALARRFYPIAIEEPDAPSTMEILMGTIPSMEHETQVRNVFTREETEAVLTRLIELSDISNQPTGRITRLPELPLTLLEMAFSYAALDSRQELTRKDLVQAVLHTNLLTKEVRMKAEEYF
ncbi:MAG: ATP-dependent Clp protease ATP-binding subunit [Eubacterium sp.]|nr:ATP-dependent Clp protease ATP-binding subunit [Eubacterium sp.]